MKTYHLQEEIFKISYIENTFQRSHTENLEPTLSEGLQ
jgi:hypothetical protein